MQVAKNSFDLRCDIIRYKFGSLIEGAIYPD